VELVVNTGDVLGREQSWSRRCDQVATARRYGRAVAEVFQILGSDIKGRSCKLDGISTVSGSHEGTCLIRNVADPPQVLAGSNMAERPRSHERRALTRWNGTGRGARDSERLRTCYRPSNLLGARLDPTLEQQFILDVFRGTLPDDTTFSEVSQDLPPPTLPGTAPRRTDPQRARTLLDIHRAELRRARTAVRPGARCGDCAWW
jgi:hypothetical protein